MLMPRLEKKYKGLYGDNENTSKRFKELEQIIKTAKTQRSPQLKEYDKDGNEWYVSQQLMGTMLYVDKFCGTLANFESKIDHLSQLGISFVHMMPLLKSREGNNDGGYAVSDFLKVEERLGTIEQLEDVIKQLRTKGIRTCIDFVLNHTAKEHEWAQKCIQGDPDYENMYHMFDDDRIPREYEKYLSQVFPQVAPGNFTYYPDINKYVMTRFYEFQWDLNYSNPFVFNQIIQTLLTLANKGVDIFRLDAIPYMWKELGTNCLNRPQVHTLLHMMQLIVSYSCPSVIFLGEAIVEPREIVKYFGTSHEKECHVMYNASMMTLLWNSLVTRDVRLMERTLSVDYGTPSDAVWINYVRCHDDIGWGFDEQILYNLGFDPLLHKQFVINFCLGTFEGSFSKGELYEFNPITLDARNCGTTASLCGLEQSISNRDSGATSLAVKRILLLHAIIISYTGIPLLYSGDEFGMLNDWSYKQQPNISHDSRWLHRGAMDWEKKRYILNTETIEGKIFTGISHQLSIRKTNEVFCSSVQSIPVITGVKGVFAFHKDDKMLVLANFTENTQTISSDCFDWFGLNYQLKDLLHGRVVYTKKSTVTLEPYECLWLV